MSIQVTFNDYVEGEKIYMKKGKRLTECLNVREKSSAFLVSDCEITVTGCSKVEEYTPELVRLKRVDGHMEIYGKSLTVSTYFGSEITLSGKIESIKLIQKNNGNECH